jgi:hypothetical protein
MNRTMRLLLGGTVLVAASGMLVAPVAMAQDRTGEQGQPTQRQERPETRPPSVVAAENYDPTGVRVGSFRLFPQLELDEVYNDNIYATPASVGKTGSFIQLVKPTLDLRSDWSRHMLNLFATGSFGIYGTDSLNNYYDYGTGFNGRYDIQRNTNVYGGASFNALHEDRGTPNTVTTSTLPPNTYNQLSANAGYYQEFNRFNVRLDGRMDNYNYTNQGGGPNTGVLWNGDRDRTELREAARFGYEFMPGYQIWVRGSLNQRNYVNTLDTQGFTHNSTGYDVVGGFALDFGGITSLEVFAGYVEQDYNDPRYTPVRAPTFGLTGYWNPIRELWVKPFVRRTVEESALESTSSYLNTSSGVDVDYRFRPNIRATGHFDYSIADYNTLTGGTAGRYDQYVTFRAEAMYLPTPEFFVGPSYQYVHRWSNQLDSDYDQNMIMLKLGARL